MTEIKDNKTVIGSLVKLFSQLSQKKKNEPLSVLDFMAIVKKKNELFNNENHHDAHEFLTWLLDVIESETKNNTNKNLIKEFFSGKQFGITKCLSCEEVSDTNSRTDV